MESTTSIALASGCRAKVFMPNMTLTLIGKAVVMSTMVLKDRAENEVEGSILAHVVVTPCNTGANQQAPYPPPTNKVRLMS